MVDALLEVTGLCKRFGARTVVDDISFSVRRGDILGLLGPNGAGKTTAIRVILGILTADGGKISFRFDGRDMAMNKSRIGYLPEDRGLYDDARVLDILTYLATLKGCSAADAKRDGTSWLERLGLDTYQNHKLDKLSKGMQQKVQFIAAVLHRPDLLVLDEPFSGLDPLNQDVIRSIIGELRSQGTAILLSAHQMVLVEELCDDILLINRGRQVLAGNLRHIKDSYEESVVDVSYAEGTDVSRLAGIPGVRILTSGPLRAHLRYSGPSPHDLLVQLAQQIEVREISLKKPPLHDIFVEAVRERGEDVDVELA